MSLHEQFPYSFYEPIKPEERLRIPPNPDPSVCWACEWWSLRKGEDRILRADGRTHHEKCAIGREAQSGTSE